jgi:cytochrome bd-type quinol oxidase subunit 1
LPLSRFTAHRHNFMGLDIVVLSRIQFALTIMFHDLFPPMAIGLGLVLVIF